MRILVSEGDIMMGDLTFEQDRITVGSLAENSVCLPGKKVAERHVIFTRNEDGVWFVETTDPNLPTTANNIELRNRVPIQEGMTIGVDRFRLKCFQHWSVRHDDADAGRSIEQMAIIRRNPLPRGTIIKSYHEEMALGAGWGDRLAVMAAELNQCPDLRVLMDYTLDLLIKVFGSASVYMGVRPKPAGRFAYVEGRTARGSVAELPKIGQHMVCRSVERAQRLCVVHADASPVVSAMSVPLNSPSGNLGVLYLDSRTDHQNYKPRHLDLLGAIAAHVSHRLARVLEGAQQVRAAESGHELGLVRAVQARLEPSRAAQWSNFEVAVHIQPGGERCSDVFDIVRQPNGTAVLLLARVRGGRMEAALTMAEIRAAFRASMLHGDMPQAALKVLNRLVGDAAGVGGVDAACVQVDPDSGRLICASGGEVVPLVLAGNGECRRLAGAPNPPLGADKKAGFTAHQDELDAGEILVLCTPGLRTVANAEGECLDPEHLLDCLKECFGQTLHQTLEEVVSDLSPYLRDGTQPDDLTIVLAGRSG